MRLDQILTAPVSSLIEYARIPIAFTVDRVLEVASLEIGPGFVLKEKPIDRPFVKNYDAIPGNAPTDWPARWDLSNWRMITALSGAHLLGGAIVAYRTNGLSMLENRADLAVLWDLRVAPECRHQGVGQALWNAVERDATAQNCHKLKIETQNINVPACRFYAKQGCTLGHIDRFAYPDLPQEILLYWYKDLA
jgi:ribosomal protein S18 acetylase RimI-like enzyme